ELLRRVQQHAAAGLAADRTLTYYLEPESGTFRMVAHRGLPEDLLSDAILLDFPENSPLAQRIVEAGTLTISANDEQDLLPLPVLDHFRIGCVSIAPLLVRGRVLGALAAIREVKNPEGPFRPEQVQLLDNIAGQLAVAIEVADLVETQAEEAAVSGALARIGQELLAPSDTTGLLTRLSTLTARVLGADSTQTFLWTPGDDAFVPVASYGFSAEVWEGLRLL